MATFFIVMVFGVTSTHRIRMKKGIVSRKNRWLKLNVDPRNGMQTQILKYSHKKNGVSELYMDSGLNSFQEKEMIRMHLQNRIRTETIHFVMGERCMVRIRLQTVCGQRRFISLWEKDMPSEYISKSYPERGRLQYVLGKRSMIRIPRS